MRRMHSSLEDRLADALRDLGEPGVAAAYLFGSHAVGRAHRESDVDVGVLLDWQRHPSRGARCDARVRIGSALIAALHENAIDVVVLHDAPPLLGRRIITEGHRVLCADAETDHAYVRDARSEPPTSRPGSAAHARRSSPR